MKLKRYKFLGVYIDNQDLLALLLALLYTGAIGLALYLAAGIK